MSLVWFWERVWIFRGVKLRVLKIGINYKFCCRKRKFNMEEDWVVVFYIYIDILGLNDVIVLFYLVKV